MDTSLLDLLWVMVCASLVFLMQAGFLCLEAGSTRSKNNINVVVKNIADFGLSVICFWLFGYALMFGASAQGWIGLSQFLPEVGQGDSWGAVFFLFQAMFCSTAVTIVSGAVAERMRFSSYLLIAILVSGLIYPVFGHWVWNGLDQDAARGWLAGLGFVDFAGSTVVHSVGGWVALAAVLVLGPRIGRFSPKRRHQQMMGYDLPLALLGTLLLWFGWFGFNGGSVLALNDQVPGILANTVLAGAAGLVTPMGLNLIQGKQVRVAGLMNGSLAGLVAITANCDVVDAFSAVIIGGIGGLVMLLGEDLLARWQIDDVVGAIPVHLGAGLWGTLAVACLGDLTLIDTGLTRLEQLGVQLTGILVGGAWAFGFTYLLLLGLNRVMPLRVSPRHEHIGLNVAEHGATSDLVDLFTVMRRQERSGNLRLRAPVALFTPVGQIAARYNRVIAALEQATARTEAMVETANEAIVTVSKPDLRVLTANPSVRKLFGLSEAQVCGQPLTQLAMITTAESADAAAVSEPGAEADEDAAASMQRLVIQASWDGNPYELEGKRRRGGRFPLEMTVARTQTQGEDFYTVILRDITLRKQAEEAIEDAAAKDLKSRQLEQALKELQQAQIHLVHSEKMSSLGQLVAGVAHEINNPVNFISGNIGYAKRYVASLLEVLGAYQAEAPDISEELEDLIDEVDLDYLREDLQKLLTSMQGGADRITEIVRSLRDFSRLGGADLKRVNLHDGIDSTLTILGSRLKEKPNRPQIYLVRDYGDLPSVECYASQLNQVFMNLLSNAIDALDEKAQAMTERQGLWTPQISITTRLVNDRVQIHVADNGVGIPDDVQRRMLDPFFTTKPVGKGTGLGMSISYQIVVDRHQGELKCISTPGRGTRFMVEIPLTPPQGKSVSPPPELASNESAIATSER